MYLSKAFLNSLRIVIEGNSHTLAPIKAVDFKRKFVVFLTWEYELVGASQALHIIAYDKQVTNISR